MSNSHTRKPSFVPCRFGKITKNNLIYSFSHSFTHSCIHSFISWFARLIFPSFLHSWINPCIHSLIRAFIHSFIHSSNNSCIRSFIHAFIHSFTRSLLHSLIYSFINTSFQGERHERNALTGIQVNDNCFNEHCSYQGQNSSNNVVFISFKKMYLQKRCLSSWTIYFCGEMN